MGTMSHESRMTESMMMTNLIPRSFYESYITRNHYEKYGYLEPIQPPKGSVHRSLISLSHLHSTSLASQPFHRYDPSLRTPEEQERAREVERKRFDGFASLLINQLLSSPIVLIIHLI